MRNFNNEISIIQSAIYKLQDLISELDNDEISLDTLNEVQESCRFMSSKFIPKLRKYIRLE